MSFYRIWQHLIMFERLICSQNLVPPIVWESRNRKKYKLAPATRLTLSLKKEEEEEKKGKNTYNCKWKRWS